MPGLPANWRPCLTPQSPAAARIELCYSLTLGYICNLLKVIKWGQACHAGNQGICYIHDIINSVATGKCGSNFKSMIFKLIIQSSTSFEIAVMWMLQNGKSHWHLAQGCFIETVLGIAHYKLLGNYVIKNTAKSGFLPDRIIHKNLFKPHFMKPKNPSYS